MLGCDMGSGSHRGAADKQHFGCYEAALRCRENHGHNVERNGKDKKRSKQQQQLKNILSKMKTPLNELLSKLDAE